jgi:homoserine O-acetyltransferase
MSEYIENDVHGVSVGIVEKQLFKTAEPPNEMLLECGTQFGPITVAYEVYGTLNADRSNAILILYWLSKICSDSRLQRRSSPIF